MSQLFLLLDSFIPSAWAQGQAATGPASSFGFLVPLVLVFVIFYFLMIRPQQKQQKERAKMLSEVKKGDAVVTTSGIYARIVGVADKILTLEIADNVKIKVDRDAVAKIQQPMTESNNK